MLARGRGARAPGGEGARPQADPRHRNRFRGGEARAARDRPKGVRRDLLAHHARPAPQQEGTVFAARAATWKRSPGRARSCSGFRAKTSTSPTGSPRSSTDMPGSPPSCIAGRMTVRSLHRLEELSRQSGLPLVAAGDVHMHVRSRRRLQDVLTAIRLGKPVAECGHALLSERRAPPAAARAPGAALSGASCSPRRVAHRRALPLLARRAALRVSGGARAARRDAGELAAGS